MQTDRGRRQFVLQNPDENIRCVAEDRCLITDPDGSRYEIPSIAALDKRSSRLLISVIGNEFLKARR